MAANKKTVCIACSIFKKEIEGIKNDVTFDADCVYHSSMLHMHPDELDIKLKADKKKYLSENKNILLLYGDCSPNINNIEDNKNVLRTPGVNCIEILLGKKQYRKLNREGAFFLMPEWTLRWKEVFQTELGLNSEIAPDFMREFHRKIVYLDTGYLKVPLKQIDAIEKYTGLKVKVLKTDTKKLVENINKSLTKFTNNNND